MGLLSCKDEDLRMTQIEDNIESSSSQCSSEDEIYQKQTDINIIAVSHINFNPVKGEYVLDLSMKDAVKLGISDELYDKMLSLVEQMNQLQITIKN